MVKNKLYLFPYGQDKCHTAYSLQIMCVFTQLLHCWNHLLFSPLHSLTLQNPVSPSCAPAGPASPQPYLPRLILTVSACVRPLWKAAGNDFLQEAGLLPRNFPGYP